MYTCMYTHVHNMCKIIKIKGSPNLGERGEKLEELEKREAEVIKIWCLHTKFSK